MSDQTQSEYLAAPPADFVSPALRRKWKSVDAQEKLRSTTRTPQRKPAANHVQVRDTPNGFHWSIEHMAVMCPADIDESEHRNQTCPFEDGPDSEIQRIINKYWDDVHDACSPGMRPLVNRSSTNCARTDASHVHSVVTEDNTANIDSSNSSDVAKNNRHGNKYLESLAKNCVSPTLFRKWKSVEDCRTPSLLSRTPKRRVNMALKSRPDPDTPKCVLGFDKHIDVTSTSGIDDNQGTNLMSPFEDDEPDSEITKSSRFKDFWDDVTDAFSPIVDPTMRKSPPVSRVRSINTEDSTPKTDIKTLLARVRSDRNLNRNLNMEETTRKQRCPSNDYSSYDVTEALEEAREILTQGQARRHSHEHVLEDATTVKVMKSGTNAEPIEVVVSRRTVVSQPNSEDEEELGGYGSGSDVDTLVRSRTSSCIHRHHDGQLESTRHTNVTYRRKMGDSWRRDVGDEVDNGDEARLEVDVKAECVENDHGSHLVKKTWEARWTVQQFDLLPEWLQDNEFLRHGHRPPLPSFSECFKSIWALHTETGNIWTHLIGCVAFVFLAFWFLTRPDTHIEFQEKVVFSFFFLGAIFCLGMSFTFHTVSCHSVGVVRIFSKLDYVGISLLIVGSFIPWIYYGFYCRMEPKITYIAMVCVLGVAAVIVSLWDKFSESKYRPFRALVFVAMGGSGVIPAIHFMWREGSDRIFDQGGFHWLLVMAGLYLLGALLYATRTPERFFPGKFDIWFQSHQLFHICVVCAALVHYYGITELAFNRLTGTCDANTGELLASSPSHMHVEL